MLTKIIELDSILIDSILKITRTDKDELSEWVPDGGGYEYQLEFSYPKFFTYLQSPQFLEKLFWLKYKSEGTFTSQKKHLTSISIGINEFLKGNPLKLIQFLEEVGKHQ